MRFYSKGSHRSSSILFRTEPDIHTKERFTSSFVIIKWPAIIKLSDYMPPCCCALSLSTFVASSTLADSYNSLIFSIGKKDLK